MVSSPLVLAQGDLLILPIPCCFWSRISWRKSKYSGEGFPCIVNPPKILLALLEFVAVFGVRENVLSSLIASPMLTTEWSTGTSSFVKTLVLWLPDALWFFKTLVLLVVAWEDLVSGLLSFQCVIETTLFVLLAVLAAETDFLTDYEITDAVPLSLSLSLDFRFTMLLIFSIPDYWVWNYLRLALLMPCGRLRFYIS